MEVILHRQAVKEGLRRLRSGKWVAVLMDQRLGAAGVDATFFGRRASTTTLPVLLAMRTKAPVFVGYAIRENNRFRIVYESIPLSLDEDKGGDAILANTQILNDRIEKIVRRQPEKWFWVHNRWK